MHKAFARHFRELVVPRLEKIARTQGFFLSLELIDYAEAFAAVWDVAIKLGVSRLDDALVYDIRDWIDDEIWRAFEKGDADRQEYRRTVADPVWHDIQQWERTLAQHLQQKEGAACQTTM